MKILKSGGGASSNVVGIICSLVEMRLTDLSKSRGGDHPPVPRFRQLFCWVNLCTLCHRSGGRLMSDALPVGLNSKNPPKIMLKIS